MAAKNEIKKLVDEALTDFFAKKITLSDYREIEYNLNCLINNESVTTIATPVMKFFEKHNELVTIKEKGIGWLISLKEA